MRIVFMGTPSFAEKPLQRLYNDGHDIAAVFTQPDKPKNRGMKITCSPVKKLATSHGTPVYQPASLRDGVADEILRSLDCELVVVVAYGKILPRAMLEIPPLGCINIHGSLLPKYRGAAPVQWAVLNGETETGVTSMFISEELDAGDVLLTKKTIIGENESAGELFERLSVLGADLLSETIGEISRGRALRIPQDLDAVSYAPPLSKDLSPIDWRNTAHSIKCKVRGLNPWPVATTVICGTIFKVYSVDISGEKSVKQPGEIVSMGKNGIEIACADTTVIIKDLQAPGGRRMAASDYLRGKPNLMLNA